MTVFGSSLAVTGLVSGVFYAVPKVLTYLCTRPEHPDASLWSRLRERMANLQEQAKGALGEHAWLYAKEILVKNAWISVIATRCLMPSPFASSGAAIDWVTAFGVICVAGWMVRDDLSRRFSAHPPVVTN